jgi:hypothetical protein
MFLLHSIRAVHGQSAGMLFIPGAFDKQEHKKIIPTAISSKLVPHGGHGERF